MRLESQRIGAENEKYEIIVKNTFLFSIINHEVIEALNVSPLPWDKGVARWRLVGNNLELVLVLLLG